MARNKAKHDNIKMKENNIIRSIDKKMHTLCEAKVINYKHCKGEAEFKEVFQVSKISHHGTNIKVFKWTKPEPGWVKLNIDGCSKGNPGQSAGGGLLRDHNGKIIKAFYKFLGFHSSFMAELMSLDEGLDMCVNMKVDRLWIETDSTSLCNTINSKVVPKWSIFNIIVDIRQKLKNLQWFCSHIWREGNCAADLLANCGIITMGYQTWNGPPPIPKLIGMVSLDQAGVEYIRRK